MLNKLAVTVFTILLPLYISAQAITTYAGHPSYTLVQLRLKNCIEVEPNGNQIYIGYRNAGMHVMQTATSSWTAYDTLNSAIPSNNVSYLKLQAVFGLEQSTDLVILTVPHLPTTPLQTLLL
ncbi:MAG: hypothetical protein IPJ79_18970 [Bacteroidetes bacterium]|nr:hypothetical protein [Bacteroidota bacterium]